MKMVPMGTQVFNVGSTTNKGAVFCRSAGTHATVIAKNDVAGIIRDVTVRLQSGEVRRVSAEACATIGVASNPHWQFRQLGKAGRSRLLNIRPTVRGLAMNAADHAHGGGRGKSKGNVHPVSIWGTPVSLTSFRFGGSSNYWQNLKQAKGGFKTRQKRNPNKHVVQERVRNQGKRRSTN
jgi:ribosomal protein L2